MKRLPPGWWDRTCLRCSASARTSLHVALLKLIKEIAVCKPHRINIWEQSPLWPNQNGFKYETEEQTLMRGAHAHTQVHVSSPRAQPPTHTHCICDPFLCWTGNGNFCKCKSAGLKIQRINVHHMWHSGRMEDILTAGGEEGQSSPGVSPTTERGRHTHTYTHSCSDSPNLLLLYLEPFPRTPPWSRAGSCVRRGASSPPRGRDTSPGSAYPRAAAPGPISELWEGEEKPSHRSANTHPLPMQTWASRPRLDPYLGSFLWELSLQP